MARQLDSETELSEQLWDRLDDTRFGMLVVRGSGQHPQPMTHFADPERGAVWFISNSDTDLVAAVGEGAEANFIYVSEGGDYQASILGPIEVSEDEAKLDDLWSVPVAAWFEKGREDPKITLLKLTPREAAIWTSHGSPILVGLKMLGAAMQDGVSSPDVGTHHVLQFDRLT